MSYITDIKGEEVRNGLIEKQNKLLADIRKIVGGRKFIFSDAYCNKVHPNIGVGEMPYSIITKKYLYVSCFVIYTNNKDNTEYGSVIKKFPICYQRGTGRFVDKIELEDLFISDLQKILDEIKFYLWWEANVQYPKVKAEYERLHELHFKYHKMKIDLGYDPEKDDDELMSMKKMAFALQKDE